MLPKKCSKFYSLFQHRGAHCNDENLSVTWNTVRPTLWPIEEQLGVKVQRANGEENLRQVRTVSFEDVDEWAWRSDPKGNGHQQRLESYKKNINRISKSKLMPQQDQTIKRRRKIKEGIIPTKWNGVRVLLDWLGCGRERVGIIRWLYHWPSYTIIHGVVADQGRKLASSCNHILLQELFVKKQNKIKRRSTESGRVHDYHA